MVYQEARVHGGPMEYTIFYERRASCGQSQRRRPHLNISCAWVSLPSLHDSLAGAWTSLLP